MTEHITSFLSGVQYLEVLFKCRKKTVDNTYDRCMLLTSILYFQWTQTAAVEYSPFSIVISSTVWSWGPASVGKWLINERVAQEFVDGV